MRLIRQDLHSKHHKRSRIKDTDTEERVARVESILSTIDEDLMAKAAFECKAYARSLLTFERQIRLRKSRGSLEVDLQPYYDRIHEIYSHLDEPDGMEGISHLVLQPSMEHQIRHHESMGHWTSAQSCWEVKLQHASNDLDSHLGLLNCLRNLGHYGV